MIKILNKYLLMHVGEREYRYGIVEEGEYIMSGLICTVYLPLPNNAENILKYSVKSGLIYVEISKST